MRIRVLTALAVLLLGVPEEAQEADQPALHADRVLVLKRERTLQLLRQGKMIRSYKVALGGDPIGPKTRQGDHKTPEGLYVLDSRNAGTRSGAAKRRFTGWGCVCPWFAKRLRMVWIIAPTEGLDRRMYRGHERRDG
jgi:hypothetical protein